MLLGLLGLPQDRAPKARVADSDFPLLAPMSYVRRMCPRDPADPLLRQVLPLEAEHLPQQGFTEDAVGDEPARKSPGLLHKYEGRALLIATGACAVHCRYCFRRHYPYETDPRRWDDWQPALDALAADPTIREVILSGGDPLMLTDSRLQTMIGALAAIPHLERLRIHSRLPIVLPDRVTDALCELLHSTRLAPIMVVHANHPNEIAGDCADALRTLVLAGIPTLNQAVLLRGVNDDAAALKTLSERLVRLGVMPYYLHQLDRVRGAAHFEVPVAEGLQLVDQLRATLPGYAVPRYVQELPGKRSKTPLN